MKLLLLLLTGSIAWGEIRIVSVTDSAAYTDAKFTPGMLVSIFCTGLDQIAPAVADYPLPTELNGLKVFIGRIEAPILSISKLPAQQQINIQIPTGIMDEHGQFTVKVAFQSESASRTVYGGGLPHLFVNADNTGIFLRASDRSLITRENPARPGEPLIAFTTGIEGEPPSPIGLPSPTPAVPIIGQLRGGTYLAGEALTPIGLTVLEISWVPGLAGVQQILFKAPLTASAPGRAAVGIQYIQCLPPFIGAWPRLPNCYPISGNPTTLWLQTP